MKGIFREIMGCETREVGLSLLGMAYMLCECLCYSVGHNGY